MTPISAAACSRSGLPSRGMARVAAFARWSPPGSRWFFVFGFPKNERSNIDKDEEEALKKLAAHLLSLPAPSLVKAQRAGELMEVNCNAQDEISDS
jgi:hypothetical protein